MEGLEVKWRLYKQHLSSGCFISVGLRCTRDLSSGHNYPLHSIDHPMSGMGRKGEAGGDDGTTDKAEEGQEGVQPEATTRTVGGLEREPEYQGSCMKENRNFC